MTDQAPPCVVVLFGPTALGKTAIATALAERLSAEVVTADSMQVYRGLPVLTNQPPEAERARIPHHLVGIVEPWEEFSAAAFAAVATATIDEVLARGSRVVVEGGSGLYVRAALGGLSFGPAPDTALRQRLEQRLAADGLEALVDDLRVADARVARHTDLRNPRRVLRALERLLLKTVDAPDGEEDRLWLPGARYTHALVVLEAERVWLRQRVDERVGEMLAAGALGELRAVLTRGPLSRTLQQAIGVRELTAHLEGTLSLEEAAARMRARTRQLVRRQTTWMRKLPSTARIPVTSRPAAAVADEIASLLDRAIAGGSP